MEHMTQGRREIQGRRRDVVRSVQRFMSSALEGKGKGRGAGRGDRNEGERRSHTLKGSGYRIVRRARVSEAGI